MTQVPNVAEALAYFMDPQFRNAVIPESAWEEGRVRYGYRHSYAQCVWETAYQFARERAAELDRMAADGPYGRIV